MFCNIYNAENLCETSMLKDNIKSMKTTIKHKYSLSIVAETISQSDVPLMSSNEAWNSVHDAKNYFIILDG